MRISSAHVDKAKVEDVYSNFAHEFRKAVLDKKSAILLFDGKDMFDFATPPHIDATYIDSVNARAETTA